MEGVEKVKPEFESGYLGFCLKGKLGYLLLLRSNVILEKLFSKLGRVTHALLQCDCFNY